MAYGCTNRSGPLATAMQNEPVHQQKMSMVYRRLNGKATLEPLEVNNWDSGQQVFEKVKARQHELSKMDSRLSRSSQLLTRLEVAVAEIKWTVTDPDESQNGGTRVDLERSRRDNLLTEAIHNPRLLANESSFIKRHGGLTLRKGAAMDGLAGQQVLLIDTVLDKGKITLLLLLFLILSPALGIIVGQFSHRADVGVAVSAGIFALASFLQGLAAWLHK
ncbi:MAG: hypothetical protein LQ338_001988 [Usnochroma carphineum]|nr:MAG: hypothetical protein LQ338_001988 [Usnochroma carphineum]